LRTNTAPRQQIVRFVQDHQGSLNSLLIQTHSVYMQYDEGSKDFPADEISRFL